MKKFRKRKSPARLQFENLENRFALAGNVTVAFTAATGDLKITGDGLENDISIAAVGGNWVITGSATVGGNGAPGALATGIVDGSGVVGGAVAIPAGGFNNVTIDLGAAKTPHLQERLTRGVRGVDAVNLNGIGGATIRGKLDIKGKDAGKVDITNLTVKGDSLVTFGTGVSGFVFFGGELGSTVSIAGGAFGVGATAAANKDLKITTGNTIDEVSLTDVSVGKDLRVDTGAGADSVTLGSSALTPSTASNTIGNSITVNTGAGDDSVNLGFFSTTKSGVTINTTKAGATDDFDFDDVTISKAGICTSLTISTGVDVDNVTVNDVFVGTDLKIDTGTGGDSVTIGSLTPTTDSNTIGGSATVNTGNGADFVNVSFFQTLRGGLSINTSTAGATDVSDDDLVSVKVGAIRTLLSITTGADQDEIGFAGVNVGTTTTVNTGTGADDVFIGDDSVHTQLPGVPENTTLNGKVTVNMGAGDGNRLAIVGDLTANNLDGNAFIGINGVGSSTSNTTLGGDLDVDGGKEEDCIGLKGVVIKGSATIDTFGGDDFIGATNITVGTIIQVGSGSPTLKAGTGNVTVNSGEGNDIVAIGVIPSGLTGNIQSDIGGNVSVNTAGGNDIVVAQNTRIRGTTNVTLGAGVDRVAIDENSFEKKVTVSGDATDNRGGDDGTNDFFGGFSINFAGEMTLGEIDAALDEILAEGFECFPDYVPLII